MFESFSNNDTPSEYKSSIKEHLKLVDGYYRKVFSPEKLDALKKDKHHRIIRAFYMANLGFDPDEKSASTALIKTERKAPVFDADTLRKVWGIAVDKNSWSSKGVAGRPKSKFTLYNPKGKPFRVKARFSAYIKATPVGVFALTYDVVVNNREYLKECYINLKHVRWVTHPFTALNKMKPTDCNLLKEVVGVIR
ncbi:MAG: hypothetical protein WC346_02935 [Methanogenium sp.]|jgi:hypothetical protein